MKNPFRDCPPPMQFVHIEPKCILPRFCSVSGHALVMECTQTGFDTCTGMPLFNRWLRCPNYHGGEQWRISGTALYRAKNINQAGTDWDKSYGHYEGYTGIHYGNYMDCTLLEEWKEPSVKKTKDTSL